MDRLAQIFAEGAFLCGFAWLGNVFPVWPMLACFVLMAVALVVLWTQGRMDRVVRGKLGARDHFEPWGRRRWR